MRAVRTDSSFLKRYAALSAGGAAGAGALEREDCRDVLVLREGLSELPAHPVIGTSSRRRVLQGRDYSRMQNLRVRGNLNTRLRKLDSGEYDALILAAAGLIVWDLQIASAVIFCGGNDPVSRTGHSGNPGTA